uniref:Uncharacterized protein n=1 Tax=Virgibacillus oceani TaxID=1479511 RepID=A0A917HEI8_9BACI|nr:hypothetical protein GCM10011398_21680 [Virgibacillus oceani]
MLFSISVFCICGYFLFRFIQPPVQSGVNGDIASMEIVKKVNQNA